MSDRKVNSKKIAIVILAIAVDVILLAAACLPNSSFSQVPPPFLSDSNVTNSNHTIIHANNNNKSLSSQGTNSYSYSLNNNDKVPKTLKPKSSSTSQTKIATEVANVSQKGIDKFGIKEIYPTKKGGREWYINMADPRNHTIFSTGFKQSIIKQNSSSNIITGHGNDDNNGGGSTSLLEVEYILTMPHVMVRICQVQYVMMVA